ncbi:hypothetical protein M9H77_18813 [Catharanthus roseus]|uniref:Uncharacterized protein n=1 Tax=Catharanthus roseus TaxID=4058 RepID=A0ACC0B8G9_CATRO|nr:hypothetical protein M9H77_18813 [Catharanthus roseus]
MKKRSNGSPTLFPQLPYTSPASTSTHSSASSTVGISSRPAPSSSECLQSTAPSSSPSPTPSSQGVVESRILILLIADSFNKQSDCAKVITKIMKAHFVEAHLSFGKVSDRIKNYGIQNRKEVSMGSDALACHSGHLAKIGFITIQELDIRGANRRVLARLDDYRTIHESL